MNTHTSLSEKEIVEALRTITVNGAYTASRALSKWFKKGIRLHSGGFEEVPIGEVTREMGLEDKEIFALLLSLEGELDGHLLLAMPVDVGIALTRLLMGDSTESTEQQYGELEISCLQETANIVGSAFTNALATWLKVEVLPGAPRIQHDLCDAVIEPLLAAFAIDGDTALVSQTEFELDGTPLEFSMLLLPSRRSIQLMESCCSTETIQKNALHAIAINGAFDASRAISKWFKKGVRLHTDGFIRVPLREISDLQPDDSDCVGLHSYLSNQLSGHILILMPLETARSLVDMLIGMPAGYTTELDDMAHSCLQETANIVGSAFVNSWARWLEVSSSAEPPTVLVDSPLALLETAVADQAAISDQVFLSKTMFCLDDLRAEWQFYLLPSANSLRLIETCCE